MIKRLLLSAFFLLSLCIGYAQVTTSSITGIIKSSKNEPLAGATIKATHTPSGTVYTAISQSSGKFTIPNMRVGGPYKVEVSFVGFGTKTYDDLNLQLGTPLEINTVLDDNSKSLTEVTVSARRGFAVISPERQGTVTNISQQQLASLPTITRNIDDFTRLTPQAQPRKSGTDGSTLGVSFAGISNKYNQFTIDGASATDVFGLASSGTNGGQASLNPIPFDAIEQVQVILSPYDVTLGGFTGGGVNAVTRSGTNTLHGSIYGLNQNQSLVGKSPDSTRTPYGKFHDWTFGARLGGALIPSKLFFFVNYEGERRSQPLTNVPGTINSALRTSALDSISNFLKDGSKHAGWTYDPGAYNGFNKEKKSDAIFVRLDWNIDAHNKLTLRHNYVNGNNFIISDGPTSMSYYNNGYTFFSKTNSTVLELNSSFNSRSSNVLRLTYTAARDRRTTPGALFPNVVVQDNGATYNFGSENSSQANSLAQNNFTFTDNYSIYAGKHTITIGTDNQIYSSKNVFLQGLVGNYTYGTLAAFFNDASGVYAAGNYATRYSTAYSTDKSNPKPVADMKAGQFSLYAQDNMQVSDRLKITYGVRADMPVFFNKPPENPTFNSSNIATANNVATNKVPKSAILVSPRIGFNWDVNGDHQTQIRGGAGLFTGRVPFVWISNQYTNPGVGVLSASLANQGAVSGAGVHFNPVNPFQPTTGLLPIVINTTDQHFKYPRTFRANLAVDQRLPWGMIATIEGIYTKTIQDISYKDLNLAPTTTTLVMGNTPARPFYGAVVNPTFSNVISLGNTNKGYGYNVTASILKPFSNGWTASIAYSLGHSYATNNGTSSVALSNYRFAYNINGLGNLDEGRSNYDQGSRIVAYVSKKFRYAKYFATTIGLVYTGQSGQRFSYVLFGDVNGDDGSTATKLSTAGGADLMWLPTDATQFSTHTGLNLTPAQQFAAFQDYMQSTKYLRDHAGKNTEINGDHLPFESHFDLKVSEDIMIFKTHTISIGADIFNVANLLSHNWGHSYTIGNQEAQPLDVEHFTKNADGTITPFFYFNPSFGLDKVTHKPWQYSDYLSRWSMQLSLRYSF